MLGMHARHRSQKQSRFLNALRTSNRRIHRAWVLKDEFDHVWHFKYVGAAKSFLKRWMTAALRSRLPYLLHTKLLPFRRIQQHALGMKKKLDTTKTVC